MSNCKVALCPYYVTHNVENGPWKCSVTCCNIHTNFGFRVRNGLRFSDRDELEAWMDMFCSDFRFSDCLYYQTIYKNGEEKPE